jgi:hypothetical protein
MMADNNGMINQHQHEVHELALLVRETLGEIKVRCPNHGKRLDSHSRDIGDLAERVRMVEKVQTSITEAIERLNKNNEDITNLVNQLERVSSQLTQTVQRLDNSNGEQGRRLGDMEKKFAYYLGGALTLLSVAHLLFSRLF